MEFSYIYLHFYAKMHYSFLQKFIFMHCDFPLQLTSNQSINKTCHTIGMVSTFNILNFMKKHTHFAENVVLKHT